jgi:hypothetical protein
MNTSHNTSVISQSPAASRSRLTRRTVVQVLYAALALQFAAWITAVVNAGGLRAAFTQPHSGLATGIIVGGAVWLVQFAAAVIVCHIRSRR